MNPLPLRIPTVVQWEAMTMTFCPHRFKNRVCVRCGITWEKANEAACAAFRGLPRENAVTWLKR